MAGDSRSDCPISCALDLLGDRWTLVVLRDLILANKGRFADLGAQEGIASNILSDRLGRLECAGLVTKERAPDDGRKRIYRPTPKANALAPVVGIHHEPADLGEGRGFESEGCEQVDPANDACLVAGHDEDDVTLKLC